MTKRIEFKITAGTDIGLVRKNNEDNFVLNPDLSLSEWFLPSDITKALSLSDVGCVIVVADGMGGANCGEVASAIAIDYVKEAFNKADLKTIIQSDYAIVNFMKGLFTEADQSIKNYASEHPESRGMGTTMVIGWLLGQCMHIAWCGDSRAYVYNKEEGLLRLSKDHSRVQSYVDQGLISEEASFGHPQSNIILRCLGDIPQEAEADYYLYSVQPSDTFLFCTDGLSAYCRDRDIEQTLKYKNHDLNACRNELVAKALYAGGYDNVTVALLSIL